MTMKWLYRLHSANLVMWAFIAFSVGMMIARVVPCLFYGIGDPRGAYVYWISAAVWAAVWAVGVSHIKLKLRRAVVTIFLGMALIYATLAGQAILWRIFSVRGTQDNAATFVAVSSLLYVLTAIGFLVVCSAGVWIIYRLRRAQRSEGASGSILDL